eukprot:1783755-Rhodomonas_salina.1
MPGADRRVGATRVGTSWTPMAGYTPAVPSTFAPLTFLRPPYAMSGTDWALRYKDMSFGHPLVVFVHGTWCFGTRVSFSCAKLGASDLTKVCARAAVAPGPCTPHPGHARAPCAGNALVLAAAVHDARGAGGGGRQRRELLPLPQPLVSPRPFDHDAISVGGGLVLTCSLALGLGNLTGRMPSPS